MCSFCSRHSSFTFEIQNLDEAATNDRSIAGIRNIPTSTKHAPVLRSPFFRRAIAIIQVRNGLASFGVKNEAASVASFSDLTPDDAARSAASEKKGERRIHAEKRASFSFFSSHRTRYTLEHSGLFVRRSDSKRFSLSLELCRANRYLSTSRKRARSDVRVVNTAMSEAELAMISIGKLT